MVVIFPVLVSKKSNIPKNEEDLSWSVYKSSKINRKEMILKG